MPANDTGTTQRRRHYSEKCKTGAIEGSESLSSAGSGTTDDRLFVQCNACASRDQRTHQTARTGVFTGVDMSRKVRDSTTKHCTSCTSSCCSHSSFFILLKTRCSFPSVSTSSLPAQQQQYGHKSCCCRKTFPVREKTHAHPMQL